MFVRGVLLIAMMNSPALGQVRELLTSAIYEETVSSIVLIKTDKGAGSGFLIDQSGLIATALHVVADANAVQVTTSTGDILTTCSWQLKTRGEI